MRKMPQICRLSSGEFVLAYNNATNDMPGAGKLMVKAFSSDLNTVLWEKQVLGDELAASTFKIEAVPGKGFIVAFGIGSTDLGIHEYDKEGNKTGNIYWNKVVRSGNYFIEVTQDKAFIVLQTRPKREDRISKVGIMALELSQ
ncbi:MAG: hypothetical protein HQ580_13250 [Planctomycetes bacterium]|nr:hypothetical protein [Planctomycetota bacterium]